MVCVCVRERETMENCAPGLISWIFSLIEKTFLLREREREHLIPHPVCKGIHGLQCLSLSLSLSPSPSQGRVLIEHAHSEYSLPKQDLIHRCRVKSVIRQPLYPQATTAGSQISLLCVYLLFKPDLFQKRFQVCKTKVFEFDLNQSYEKKFLHANP